MNSKKRKDLPSLTGLRFFAAYAIVMHHSLLYIFRTPPPALHSLLATAGGFGMSLFFILSGFIIHYNYSDQLSSGGWRTFWNFISARIARLYPLFICFLAFDLGLAIWRYHSLDWSTIRPNLPWFLTMTHSWFYVLHGSVPTFSPFNFSNVSWSISTEFFLYFLYPFMMILFSRVRSLKANVLLLLFLIIVQRTVLAVIQHNAPGIERFAVEAFGPMAGPQNASVYRFFDWLSFNSPYIRLFEFLIGISVCQVFCALDKIEISRIGQRIGEAMSWCGVGLISLSFAIPAFCNEPIKAGMEKFGYQPGIVLIILCLPLFSSIWRHITEARIALMLGEVSYSIYLVHGPVLSLFHRDMWNALDTRQKALAIGSVVVASALIFALSQLTYRWVESPGRKLLRRLLITSRPTRKAEPLREAV